MWPYARYLEGAVGDARVWARETENVSQAGQLGRYCRGLHPPVSSVRLGLLALMIVLGSMQVRKADWSWSRQPIPSMSRWTARNDARDGREHVSRSRGSTALLDSAWMARRLLICKDADTLGLIYGRYSDQPETYRGLGDCGDCSQFNRTSR